MKNRNKLDSSLKEKVLEAKITKLEGALIRKIREFEYGKITLVVHKIEGQPIRIEVTEVNQSCVLQAKDGMNLEGAVWVDSK